MDIVSFNWVDYTILGILGFSILISLARGFVREAISLATWIVAIWVAYKYGHDFGQSVLTMISSDQARLWVGASILFFGILIVGALISFAIGRVVSFTGLSVIDRILGMAFGFARGVLLIAILLLVGEIMQADKKPWWGESQLIPQFSGLSQWLKGFVPEQFEKLKQEALQKAPGSAIAAPQQSVVAPVPQAMGSAKQPLAGAAPAQVTVVPPVTSAPVSVPAIEAPSSPSTTTTTVQPPPVVKPVAPAPIAN